MIKKDLRSLLKETDIYVIHALNGYDFQEKHVIQLLSQYNLDFSFITDGDPSLTDKTTLDKYFTEEFRAQASVGGVSCTLNHIYAYKKLVESKKKYALVFENDPYFLPNFEQNLINVYREIEKLENGFIVSLENTTLRFPSFFQVKKNKILYRAKVGRMAGAYIIDSTAAEKSVQNLKSEKCNNIVDWWHNRLIELDIIKMYWAHPPLVEQGSHNGLMTGTISSK